MKHSTLLLPADGNGQQLNIPPDTMRIVVVGANGTGKSRFTARIAADLGAEAYCMSALNALYERDRTDPLPSSIDTLYANAVAAGMPGENRPNQLERMMSLLMRDEMLNLIGYKIRHAENPDTKLRPTRLDTVISLWQEIFPDSKVLIESGKLLFARSMDESDSYSALKLSAGEKAVMYYIGAITYAPKNATVIVDSPEMFLHPTITQSLWNRIELLRPDCRFIYTTHDLDFASSRTSASVVWVRSYDAAESTWDYQILPPREAISDEIYMAIIGARKPVLFIEGDGKNSIDSKLYPLIFKDYTVQSLGSCNKVIEATRTFNDLASFHRMDSSGIVDRDRRDDTEVAYLRRKKIMVPEVAEIENMLLLEDVVRAMAESTGNNADRVFAKVRKTILSLFRADLRQQALMHTRHRMKRTLEYRVDAKCRDIAALEHHLAELLNELDPRRTYEDYCRRFHIIEESGDYGEVLKVYNQKSILTCCNVAQLCGFKSREHYIEGIMEVLRHSSPQADAIRRTVRACLMAGDV